VEITNLPKDKFFNHSDLAFKAWLWNYIELVMNDQFSLNAKNPNKRINFDTMLHMNVVDINFAKSDLIEFDLLSDLTALRKKRYTNGVKSRIASQEIKELDSKEPESGAQEGEQDVLIMYKSKV